MTSLRENNVPSDLLRGMIAGVLGTVLMTVGEKLEQTLTGRPNSYVPAHTLQRLLGLNELAPEKRPLLNWVMHLGTGMMGGIIRTLMARAGARGPVGSFIFTGVRLSIDQTLENATAVGAPPWTWPVDEQIIDFSHKAVYAFTTGSLVDHWVGKVDRSAHPEIRKHITEQSSILARPA
jgi:hypothetical protein